MLEYSLFYRRFGIRKRDQLTDPPLESINNFALPKDAVLHYVSTGPGDQGISIDDPLLRDVEKTIMVDHVIELTESLGTPRKMAVDGKTLAKAYHRKNRQLRPLRRMETALRDPRMVVVVNYALLPDLYRYTNTLYKEYNRWYNQTATMWDKVGELAGTGRHQFIPFTLPRTLPSLTQLIKAEQGKLTKTLLDIFHSEESLNLLDLWTWAGENRDNSVMGRVDSANLRKVNLVFMESGRFIILNLGQLEDWRGEGEGDENSEASEDGPLTPKKMQRRLLKMMMILFEMRTAGAGDGAIKEFIKETEDTDDGETDPNTLPGKVKGGHEKESEKEVLTGGEKTGQTKKVSDAEIEDELETYDNVVESLNKRAQAEVEATGYVPPPEDVETPVKQLADDMVDAGLLSAAEYRRVDRLSKRYKEIANPFGEGTLEDLATITQEDVKLPESNPLTEEIPGVVDQSMLNNTTKALDEKYIKDLYHKDIAAAVLSVQKAGVTIQNYTVEKVEEHLNDYEIHTMKVVPVVGAPSTLRFRVPIVKEDGTFKANGVKYRMRKQRGDMPIRKTSPFEVALTSYYGKLFVQRTERAVNNYEKWLTNLVSKKGLDNEDNSVTELRFSNVFDPQAQGPQPRVYTLLSKTFSSFVAGDFFLYFNLNKRHERFGDIVNKVETGGMLFVGTKRGGSHLVMDQNSVIYSVKEGGSGNLITEGTIEEIIGLSEEQIAKKPVEILEVGIFGKAVPLGFVLAHEVGLNNLLKYLKLNPRRVPRGTRLQLAGDEFSVRFEDESLVFDRSDKMAEYIFGGFNRYHRDIKRFSLYDFDKKDVYQVVMERNGLGARYVRELDMMYKMFVDPITKSILEEINEPTDLVALFVRAAELLKHDEYPDAADMRFMRDKGYERVSGVIYGELVRALRGYKAKPASSNATVDLNPQAVWMTMMEDPAKSMVEESNPISNLREKEVVVFSGVGGRGKRSMTAKHRGYHRSHMGTTSESTVDSGDVATIVYLSADPNYTSVRGTTRPYDPSKDGPAKLVSPAMLLSPAADRDDPKRVNFIAIQHAQTISADGYTPTPLRTGYERVIAHRTDDLFAYTAKQDGQVVEKTDEYIKIVYKDGTEKTIELGRRFGNFAGAVIPHNVISELKTGARFKKDDVLAYNTNYFTRDKLDPKQVIWKAGVMATVALMEGTDTFEDSSAISQRLAEKMATDMSKVRNIRVAFDQEVRKLVQPGEKVDIESILCMIENPVGAGDSLFDEETLETLKGISSLAPKAKIIGQVERIEVLYNGDKEDMSPSLKKLANASDRELSKRAEAAGKPKVTGRVDTGYRIDNRPLDMDSAVIKVYMTGKVPAGVGDKGVFASQMKTVFGRVLNGINQTEDGRDIDAIFGYQSIVDRIVMSPAIMGTTNTLLKIIGQKAVAAYRGKDSS